MDRKSNGLNPTAVIIDEMDSAAAEALCKEVLKAKRGGHRPGAGRKRKTEDGPRVNVTVMVAPVTRQRITALRAKGVLLGEAFDDFIAQLASQHSIE